MMTNSLRSPFADITSPQISMFVFGSFVCADSHKVYHVLTIDGMEIFELQTLLRVNLSRNWTQPQPRMPKRRKSHEKKDKNWVGIHTWIIFRLLFSSLQRFKIRFWSSPTFFSSFLLVSWILEILIRLCTLVNCLRELFTAFPTWFHCNPLNSARIYANLIFSVALQHTFTSLETRKANEIEWTSLVVLYIITALQLCLSVLHRYFEDSETRNYLIFSSVNFRGKSFARAFKGVSWAY